MTECNNGIWEGQMDVWKNGMTVNLEIGGLRIKKNP
jgi:hypothetical protein